jgi:multidrug efflux pump
MNIFAPLIRRPIGTSLLAIGLMLAGVWAYMLLGVAALPSLDFPGVYVVAQQPGASAQTMANTSAVFPASTRCTATPARVPPR